MDWAEKLFSSEYYKKYFEKLAQELIIHRSVPTKDPSKVAHAIKECHIEAYRKYFTQDELEVMYNHYETPTGKKCLEIVHEVVIEIDSLREKSQVLTRTPRKLH